MKMQKLNPLEQKIVNIALYHGDNEPSKWSGTTNKFDEWYRVAHAHILNKIRPRVEHHLVNYWPTYFLWASGATHKRSFYEDRAYLYKEGIFGTGYTVLTLRNLVLVSLKQVTSRFPLFDKGMISGVLGRMVGEVDNRQPFKEDRVTAIPLDSILDAQLIHTQEGSDAIAVRTANEQILMFEHFTNQQEEIVAAIRMAKSGKLARILNPTDEPNVATLTPDTSSENPVMKLKQLKEMLDLNLINEETYTAKRTEILSKM
jgi:hypothetical protein